MSGPALMRAKDEMWHCAGLSEVAWKGVISEAVGPLAWVFFASA
jgi:hypothetical protein